MLVRWTRHDCVYRVHTRVQTLPQIGTVHRTHHIHTTPSHQHSSPTQPHPFPPSLPHPFSPHTTTPTLKHVFLHHLIAMSLPHSLLNTIPVLPNQSHGGGDDDHGDHGNDHPEVTIPHGSCKDEDAGATMVYRDGPPSQGAGRGLHPAQVRLPTPRREERGQGWENGNRSVSIRIREQEGGGREAC